MKILWSALLHRATINSSKEPVPAINVTRLFSLWPRIGVVSLRFSIFAALLNFKFPASGWFFIAHVTYFVDELRVCMKALPFTYSILVYVR